MTKWLRNIGPGTLIAAAFIGPGTVTVCTLAGVEFGFDLLWAMMLSIVATITLQEMAARLGIVANKGLAEVVRAEIANPALNRVIIILILSAIVIGNAAYEAGNISGGMLGLSSMFGDQTLHILGCSLNLFSILIGSAAFLLLYLGNYKFLERVFVLLVLVMSLSFLTTAVLIKPDILDILKGLFIPKFPENSMWTVLGLIGTTVVPYNLFLHASLVKEKWKGVSDLRAVKNDTFRSIILGGLVSISIIISASAAQISEVSSGADLAMSLEPLYGKWSSYLLGVGLFAAGITSAITAPLAAAYVVKGCFGWKDKLKSKRFRLVWAFILLLGVILSSIGLKPIRIIQFAQVANGVLLPIIAGILLWVVNKRSVLGAYVNSKLQNIVAFFIVLITLFLGVKGILKVFQLV